MTEPYRKKLIEVAIPLEAINEEASLRKRKAPAGYPTTLHKWWAQRPLAACRAVLFASLVDDPSSRPDLFPTEDEQERERLRLFRLIEKLVKWENSRNEEVLAEAREEILKATGGNPPAVLDPFAGGGSIPLEAQRLGLEAYASDLNPVPVLITKALIEIPAAFGGDPPLNPAARTRLGHGATWQGAEGLAEDIRYYGWRWRDRAFAEIGPLYPTAQDEDGTERTVVAWIWARTGRCANPACEAELILAQSFSLSTRKGREAYVVPRVLAGGEITFEIGGGGTIPASPKVGRGAQFRCLVCSEVTPESELRRQFQGRRPGQRLMAIVADGSPRRLYLSRSQVHETIAESAKPNWEPEEEMNSDTSDLVSGRGWGIGHWRELFTARQLTAMATFVDLLPSVEEEMRSDGADEKYIKAVTTYLALALSRVADYGNAFASWRAKDSAMRSAFAQQALPMMWDFAEGNPFGPSSAGLHECVEVVARCVQNLPCGIPGVVRQLDATAAIDGVETAPLVCTDPPYYDNISYADLSDFFYIWLRRTIGKLYPDVFSTLLVPKASELVAAAYRFDGDRRKANEFFEAGLGKVFQRVREYASSEFPFTVFYAFRQSEETDDAGVVSTGWESMLTGLLDAGFQVTGTWPMRTEGDNRRVGIGANALASSIVLVVRPRANDAPLATRRELVSALRAELPSALTALQKGSVAPVDLAQAAIGPGMAIFSRYQRVLEADGSEMSVRKALGLINQLLDEILAQQDGDFDPWSRFAIAWFEQHGFSEGPYGDAETLATAKAVTVRAVEQAGILEASKGKARLIPRSELPSDWDPLADQRFTVWEATQHLVQRLEVGGEASAAMLLRRLGGVGDVARALAYRLYTVSERKGRPQEALAYNALVVAWLEISRLAADENSDSVQQTLGV